MKFKKWLPTLAVAVIIAAGAGYWVYDRNRPGPLDGLAQCLTDKGALFYGAFWCPHCQTQKEIFGSSARLLPYVECSTADGREQLPLCEQKDVTGYPTWVFPDGTRESGEISPARLAEKTGCPLPPGAS